jgi:pectinesterase
MDRRSVIGLGLAMVPGVALASEDRWDAIVDSVRRPGTVGTIAEALAKAGGGPFRILLRPGTYVEKLTITQPDVTLQGSGPDSVIAFGAYAGLKKADGSNTGTSGSATITVNAPGVTFRNLTIRNTYDYIGAKRDNAGNGSQAVALLIGREADRCTVEDCSLEGYQDTLYIQPRARVTNFRIVGGVDFIFGGGAVWFDRCAIVTRFIPNTDSFGYLAAPSTPASQEFGLVFHRCRIGRERGVTDRSTWLGRPWRAGGNMSLLGQAAFLHCWMDGHIRREGWTSMGYSNPAGERTMLTPQEARMFEYGSTGPGAGPVSETRKLLDAAQAARYTRANVLGDWA